MGILDKAKAIANEAVDAGKRATSTVVVQADEIASHNNRVGIVLTGATETASRGRETIRIKTEEISKSSSGQAAGKAVKKVGGFVSSLPGPSVAMDVIRAKNCVDILLEKFRANPNDAYCNIWLAESLIKTSQDIKKYRYATGALDPSSFVIAGVLRKTAHLGNDALSMDEKLLRRAWILSTRSLRESLRNSSSLDVLARVYLAKGDSKRAIYVAQAAIVADHSNPIPRITLSRALLKNGATKEAERAGMSAVTCGSTVGYLMAAEAIQLRTRDTREVSLSKRVAEYEGLVVRVTASDRARYSGSYRDVQHVATTATQMQTDKAGKTWATMKRWGGIIRNA